MGDEREHLELADRHIREAEARIAGQEEVVREMAADGRGAAGAEALLATLRDSLALMLDHRVLIVEALARLEGPA